MTESRLARASQRFASPVAAGSIAVAALVFGPGCAASGDESAGATVGSPSTPLAPVDPDRPWTVPAGWTEDPEPRQMRLATYMAPDPSGSQEVAITRFGGRVGGDLPNVNRWRRQMGLGPATDADLEGILDRFTVPGYEGYRIRLESDRGVMLVVAVYEVAEDRTWFVRTRVADTATADRMQADVFAMGASITGAG